MADALLPPFQVDLVENMRPLHLNLDHLSSSYLLVHNILCGFVVDLFATANKGCLLKDMILVEFIGKSFRVDFCLLPSE